MKLLVEIAMLNWRLRVLEHLVSMIAPNVGINLEDLKKIQEEETEKLRKEYSEFLKEYSDVS